MTNVRSTAGAPPVDLVTVGSNDSLFGHVFALGESQKRLLGMLPKDAWIEYADDGRLLAAVEANEDPAQRRVLGYAAFRLPRQRVVLAHLVVRPDCRGAGIARMLVDQLSLRYPDRRGILAKCRRDHKASSAWPALGFIAQGDLPGRGNTPAQLTVWWRDHGHPDLMTWAGAPASLIPVVIDANVFLDIHTDAGGQSAHTRELLTETLFGRVELLVTPELGNEVNRQDDHAVRARLQAKRQSYPTITLDRTRLEANRTAIEAELGRRPANKRDASDLLHIAYAATAGVQVVVTRDDRATRKLRASAGNLFDVALVSPQELVALLDELEAGDAYSPFALLGTGYAMREATLADQALLDSFLDNGSGERRADFTRRMRELAEHRATGANRLLFVAPSGDAVALLGSDVVDGVLDVRVLRMKAFSLAATMAAQLVSQLRPLATAAAVSAIRVSDPHPNALLTEALLADGFGPAPTGPIGLAVDAACAMHDASGVVRRAAAALTDQERDTIAALLHMADTIGAGSAAEEVAALERQARPLRILDAPLDTWIVPIKPVWSSQLFSVPPDIYGQTPELGISVEHVYYRGGRSGEAAPARVLWYVSGKHTSMVIGCSELIEVKDGTPKTLHREFRRLGVYDWQQVNEVADQKGMVRALRVTNTELFDSPITLTRLRQLAAEEGQTLQLISPRRISTGLFACIITEGRT
jgi:predicted nucleic acid-binding protein/GNAT superfamily N-acetyltransferase